MPYEYEYGELNKEIEEEKGGTVKSSIRNIPIDQLRGFLIFLTAGFILLVFFKVILPKYLLYYFIGLAILLIILGWQKQSTNWIKENEAKDVLITALREKQKLGSPEFDCFPGTIIAEGSCNIEKNLEFGFPEWRIGWAIVNSNGFKKLYKGKVRAERDKVMVTNYGFSIGTYRGEERKILKPEEKKPIISRRQLMEEEYARRQGLPSR